MARIARIAQFSPDEMAIVHVVNRAVRRVFLMGYDKYSGKNYDYRKAWIEQRIQQLAAGFAIDVLGFSILSNHTHLILRQRPDLVQSWSDAEVARRWLLLCPRKRSANGQPCEPTQSQLNSICGDKAKLQEIRRRLSDISWWMRLMCQTIAQRINAEDQENGRVWQDRYRAVRLLDESALLACAAYVDLNPIRAGLAETLEQSDFTSVQRRIQALKQQLEEECLGGSEPLVVSPSCEAEQAADVVSVIQSSAADSSLSGPGDSAQASQHPSRHTKLADRFLAPLHLDELRDALRILPSDAGYRCSDRGFLNMTTAQYLELLDWTARLLAPGKRGSSPVEAPAIWQRLGLSMQAETWLELVGNFGKLFKLVAGKPHIIDAHRGVVRPQRFKMSPRARELLTAGSL